MEQQRSKEIKHGTTIVVESPDTLHSRRFLDFGKGFYTTPNGDMALNWAKNKMERNGTSEGYINFYEVPEPFPGELNVKNFPFMNEEWLDFIMANRNREFFTHDYDIVIGPTADLYVKQIIREYEDRLVPKKETLEKLKGKQIGTQISFHTDKALKCVKFIRAQKVTFGTPPGTTKKKDYGNKR